MRPAESDDSRTIEVEPFIVTILRAVTFTLSPRSLMIEAGLALFCSFFEALAEFGSIMFLLALVPLFIAYGTYFGYLSQIVRETALGEEELPGMPDFRDRSDLVMPVAAFYVAVSVCFGPSLLIYYFDVGGAAHAPLWAALVGLIGIAYFPGAVISASYNGIFGAFIPGPVVQMALRIPGPYLMLALVVCAGVILQVGAGAVVGLLGDIPIISRYIFWLSLCYVGFTVSRIFGKFLFVHQHELGI